MKNPTALTLTIILTVVSFITVFLAKTQISTLEAEILFTVTSFSSCVLVLENKKDLKQVPVKVKAFRKY